MSYKTFQRSFTIRDVAIGYVYESVIPCMNEILLKRGNNINMERVG